MLLLESAIKQYRRFQQREFAKRSIDLTPDQWSVLECAAENPGIVQKDIANLTLKDPASVTRIIDILADKGFIERKNDLEDRRAVRIHVTNKGKDQYQEILTLTQEMLTFGLRNISGKEQEVCWDLLKKIKVNFD